MKFRKSIAVIVVLLCLIVLGGVGYKWLGDPAASTAANTESLDSAGDPSQAAEEEKIVTLTEDQMKKFGVEVGKAGPGKLQVHVTLPGEVAVNADRMAHIIPRVPGVVLEVRKNLGDTVKKGEVMAVLESRDLADAKASFLAARERVGMAETNFNREEQLWQKKISAEQEYLQTKQALSEAQIELRSAEQKLHALGFPEPYLKELPQHPELNFTRYEIISPFDATVIEKHITLGEVLKDDTEAFMIADLSDVWVNLNVYQKDLPFVRQGQPVTISVGHGVPDAQGVISYIGSSVSEQTRTTPARIVLANPNGIWRTGLFVMGRVTIENVEVSLLVPKDAVLLVDGKMCCFIKTKDGFEPQPVVLGRTNDVGQEIVSGLTPGQPYVTRGAFTLKSELGKSTEEE